MGKML